MASRSNEIRVGIAVTLASLILIVGVLWLQRFKLVEKRYGFYVRFPEVGGLTKDDPIMVNGVERGRVRDVRLHKHGVVVEMGIREGVSVPVDCKITLRSIGIMGERFVSITGGKADLVVSPGDTLSGVLEAGLSEVMGEAGRVLGELVETTSSLNRLIEDLLGEGRLGESMDNIRSFSEGMRDIASGGDAPLVSAITRLDRVTTLLDSLLSRRYSALDSTLASVARAGPKIDSTISDLHRVSVSLRELTDRLNRGEGTLGKLIKDEGLVEKIDSTVTDLNGLIEDIKKHPGRYLSIRLF